MRAEYLFCNLKAYVSLGTAKYKDGKLLWLILCRFCVSLNDTPQETAEISTLSSTIRPEAVRFAHDSAGVTMKTC